MIVEQYGLKYTRVTSSDLELIRYWRNQDYIRNTMQFKEYISPTMQQKWFESIDNKNNYYFIIHDQSKKIGLVNCKDASISGVAEGGIFIWDKTYWGTAIPAFASLSMLQAVFEIFKAGSISLATVAINNDKALSFNKMLGYKILETTPDGNYYKLQLSIEDYFSKTKKIFKAANILSNHQNDFKLLASIDDKQSDEINQYIKLNL